MNKRLEVQKVLCFTILAAALLAISGCTVASQAAHEIAVREGLSTDQFKLRPGDCVEGGVFCYLEFFEIEDGTYVSIFQDSGGLHAGTGQRYLTPSMKWVSYQGENLPVFDGLPQWFYPKWAGRYYTLKLDFIDNQGVATLQFEEW